MARLPLRPAHLSLLGVCGLSLLVTGSFTKAASTDVILVEEHWELHVGGPDASRTAPQVTMFMSPTESLSGDYFAFTLNHWTYPDFAAGGYQLQRWHGDDCVQSNHGSKTSQLFNDGETITWVQRISLNDGVLKFQVLGGNSESWGQFGGAGFALTVPTELTKLNGYRPGNSIDQSGIGYAGNRVSSLILQKIRWITADGEEHQMVAPIDIHSKLDP
jgi:hypothetical protein